MTEAVAQKQVSPGIYHVDLSVGKRAVTGVAVLTHKYFIGACRDLSYAGVCRWRNEGMSILCHIRHRSGGDGSYPVSLTVTGRIKGDSIHLTGGTRDAPGSWKDDEPVKGKLSHMAALPDIGDANSGALVDLGRLYEWSV